MKRRGGFSGNGIIFHYANLISFKEDSQTISYVEAILTGISNIIGLTDRGIVNCTKLNEVEESPRCIPFKKHF